MELSDLDREERVALIGLVEWIGESGGKITDQVSQKIDDIVEALGEKAYRDIADEVDDRFEDEDSLRAFLPLVKRQEAREVIYGAALDVAIGDAIQRNESDLLDWLAREWSIVVQVDRPEGDE